MITIIALKLSPTLKKHRVAKSINVRYNAVKPIRNISICLWMHIWELYLRNILIQRFHLALLGVFAQNSCLWYDLNDKVVKKYRSLEFLFKNCTYCLIAGNT